MRPPLWFVVVDRAHKLNMLYLDTGFFEGFSTSAFLPCFSKLQMASRRTPSSGTMRAQAFAHQHFAIFHDEKTDPNLWPV